MPCTGSRGFMLPVLIWKISKNAGKIGSYRTGISSSTITEDYNEFGDIKLGEQPKI